MKKKNTQLKQCRLGTTQHIVRALHSDSGSNRHVSITHCAARSCIGHAGIQHSLFLSEKPMAYI